MTIEEALNAIKNAIYGKDVRQAMHDGILQAEGGAGTVAKEAALSAREAEIASKAVEGKADQAVTIATSAKNKSDSTKQQLDEIVIKGDSSVEAAQARVDITNYPNKTLSERLNTAEANISLGELSSKGKTEYSESTKSALVIISDDAMTANEDALIPLFIDKGVPLNLAVIPSRVGNSSYMSYARLKELQDDYDFGMVSHSVNHVDITALPYGEAENEYRDSFLTLRENGLKVDSFAVPNGKYNNRSRRFSKKYYRASRTSDAGTNKLPLQSHELKTYWLDDSAWNTSLDVNFYKTAIDQAVLENELLIISTHGQMTNESIIATFGEIIDYASAVGLPIMSMSEAIDNVGNVIEIGDYSRNLTLRNTKGYFVVGADGLVESAQQDFDYNFETAPKDIPNGISYTVIDNAKNSTSPSGGNGILTTYKLSMRHATHGTLNWQEFIPAYEQEVSYVRSMISDEKFADVWKKKETIPKYVRKDDTKTLTSTFIEFEMGITFTYLHDVEEIPYPSHKRGTLITYINHKGAGVALNYQEYVPQTAPEITYRRIFTGSTSPTFGDWQMLNTEYRKDNLSLESGLDDFNIGTTHTAITSVSGTPTGEIGMLKTVKHYESTETSKLGLNYQEFKPIGKPQITYSRYFTSEANKSEWTLN